MLKNEREREILDFMKSKNGFATVKELCDTLYVSESSIRRDLSALEHRGAVRRTHGGAELVSNFSNAVAFSRRSRHNMSAKKLIAKKAAALVKDGDIIFLDQSSSAYFLAAEIMENASLTVVTNNVEIINLLADSKIKIIASGGILFSENRACLVGGDAERVFSEIYANAVFFSTKSLSYDGIVSDPTREEVLVRTAMMKNAAKRIYLCDSEKFGTRSAYKQCNLSDIDVLVTEEEPDEKIKSIAKNIIII